MITCKLKGGLGNQLFQIATGISYAIDTDQEFKLSKPLLRTWHAGQGVSPISYIDTIFNKIELCDYVPNNSYKEASFNFERIPSDLKNCILDGYFQSYKYFNHNRNAILRALYFDHTVSDDLDYSQLCSIHVRRGDYIKLKHYHLNLDIDYYDRAMEMVDCGKFLVFSDDIDWCKSVFTGDRFIFSNQLNADSVIYMMSKCSSNIIANSTLSWWGAWLNNSMNKRVVAPNKWFVNDLSSDDLIPEEWMLVK